MYQRQLEALITFASADPYKEELLKAKQGYFARTGDIFEDDRSFEMRIASFLDYYVFDWPVSSVGRTPAQLYLDKGTLDEKDRAIVQGLTRTRHSLWEVRKIAPELVRLRDCFTGKDEDVFERRQPAGLKKGDLIEARLIPVDGRHLFSPAFCFHPDDAKKAILKEIKRLKKMEPEFSRREFIWSISGMRLKYDRYRNVSVKDIYAFDRERRG